LEVNSNAPSQLAKEKRETYAKMALMMFFPFRELDDLITNGSYWTTFDRERRGHFNGRKTRFWAEGFEILQNIEDRLSMEKSNSDRTRDPVQLKSILKTEDKKKKKNEADDVKDISYFEDSDDELDIEDSEGYMDGAERTHDHLINRLAKKFKRQKWVWNKCKRFISPCITSKDNQTLIQSTDDDEPTSNNAGSEDAGSQSINARRHDGESDGYYKDKGYPTFIKLISGALVGGSTSYNEIYEDDNEMLYDDSNGEVAGDGMEVDEDTAEVQNEHFTQVSVSICLLRCK